MSYNGKVFSVNTGFTDETVEQRLIDFEIPKEVMKELYIPIDGKVYISDNGNLTAKMKLDNSEGGRELNLGFRVNDSDSPASDWWNTGGNVQRVIRKVPWDVLSFIGMGYADDQIRIKYTVDTSTWSATLEKISVI